MIHPEVLETATKMWNTAQDKRTVARELHESGHSNDAISRAYYSAFHLVSLVMFLHGETFSKHSQLIGSFNKDLVLSGQIDRSVGKAVHRLFELRQGADYDVFEKFSISDSEAALQDLDLVFSGITPYMEQNFSWGTDYKAPEAP